MKKFYIISLLSVFLTTPAWAADTFICSYTAQISPQDKLNSSGKSIISGYDKKKRHRHFAPRPRQLPHIS